MAETVKCAALKPWFVWGARVVCILVLILQSSITNYYLVTYTSQWWYCIIIADVIVLAIFLVAFIVSYRYLHLRSSGSSNKTALAKDGQLPLGYIAWAVFAAVLSIKVLFLFKDIAHRLDESNFFGPNTLKTALALSSLVFLLLVLTHNEAKPKTERQTYIISMTSSITIDILDTVSILDILFVAESRVVLPHSMHFTIIGVACANLLLPTLMLLVLSRTRFGKGSMPKKLHFVHLILYWLVVNVPLLIIRSLLWHLHDQNVSVFLIKNVLGLAHVIRRIHEDMVDISEAKPTVKMEEVELAERVAHEQPETLDESAEPADS